MLSISSSCSRTTLTVSLYISEISWIDFSISLYSRIAVSCSTSVCDSSKNSGLFSLISRSLVAGTVAEVGSLLALRACVRCISLKRKVACSNLSSIAMRIDSFSFSAVCLRDLMSTVAIFKRLMSCSHPFRCYFTFKIRFVSASFQKRLPSRLMVAFKIDSQWAYTIIFIHQVCQVVFRLHFHNSYPNHAWGEFVSFRQRRQSLLLLQARL